MVKDNFKKIVIGLLAVLLLAVIYLFISKDNQIKVVYFDANEVFDGFNLTKEIEKEIEKEFSTKQLMLDSIKIEMDYLNQQFINGDTSKNVVMSFKSKGEQYQFLENKFIEERAERLTEFNNQVILQMKEYVDLYRINNNIDMLIGNSSGGMISVRGDLDVTKDLLDFLNKKYEGIE